MFIRGCLAGIAAVGWTMAIVSIASPAGGTTTLKATLTSGYLHTTSRGGGSATITISPTRVCWKFSFHGITKPGVSGVHVAPPSPHGAHTRSVFPFTGSTSQALQCEAPTRWGNAGPAWLAKILANPGGFFVIVGDDAGYQAGAIGGVLHTA